MHLIAQHSYIEIERKVTSTEQYEIELDQCIYLYNEKVVTQNKEFPIGDVTDFSYRKMTNQGGFLYLHTLQGVYPYIVKSSPEAFIMAYKTYFNEKL